MKVLLRLLDTSEKATDGSIIPRRVLEDYLSTDEWKDFCAKRLALGGISHKSRKLDDKYKGLAGNDDQIFIDKNVTHVLYNVYFKDTSDPSLYGEVEILDPDSVEGEQRENILSLISMLKSGVCLPVSIVVQAFWDPDNTCRKITKLKGVDFTLNPGFAHASTLKVFSNTNGAKDIVKTYSSIKNEDGSITKTFSSKAVIMTPCNGESEKLEKKTKLLGDCIDCEGEKIISPKIKGIVIKSGSSSHSIIKNDNGNIVSTTVKKDLPTSVDILNPSQLDDFDSDPFVGNDGCCCDEEECFSKGNYIEPRMYIETMPRQVKWPYIKSLYKSYFSTINGNDRNIADQLFESDLIKFLRDNKEEMLKRRTGVGGMFAITDKEESQLFTNYSMAMYKLDISLKNLGFVPKEILEHAKDSYMKLKNHLINYIHGI